MYCKSVRLWLLKLHLRGLGTNKPRGNSTLELTTKPCFGYAKSDVEHESAKHSNTSNLFHQLRHKHTANTRNARRCVKRVRVMLGKPLLKNPTKMLFEIGFDLIWNLKLIWLWVWFRAVFVFVSFCGLFLYNQKPVVYFFIVCYQYAESRKYYDAF